MLTHMNLQLQKVKYFEAFLTYHIYYFKFKTFLAFYVIATKKLYNATALFHLNFLKMRQSQLIRIIPKKLLLGSIVIV